MSSQVSLDLVGDRISPVFGYDQYSDESDPDVFSLRAVRATCALALRLRRSLLCVFDSFSGAYLDSTNVLFRDSVFCVDSDGCESFRPSIHTGSRGFQIGTRCGRICCELYVPITSPVSLTILYAFGAISAPIVNGPSYKGNDFLIFACLASLLRWDFNHTKSPI